MSTTSSPGPLCAGLVDDAAVFPPGSSPVGRAWREHQELQEGPYAECVGPLLLAPEHVAPLLAELAGGRTSTGGGTTGADVSVVLVSRAGTSLTDLDGALADLLAARPATGVRVVALEVAHVSGWQRLLTLGLPLVVEVSRDERPRDEALHEIVQARAAGHSVRAKLRTQPTPAGPVPTADELADFVEACTQRRVPFKLTGGLHHAVVSPTDRDRQHGALNVLLATHTVLAGAPRHSVRAVLTSQDAQDLGRQARDLSTDQVSDLRSAFTAYGCCAVLDPLTELAELGLLLPSAPALGR